LTAKASRPLARRRLEILGNPAADSPGAAWKKISAAVPRGVEKLFALR
jgi:hypothetical protein